MRLRWMNWVLMVSVAAAISSQDPASRTPPGTAKDTSVAASAAEPAKLFQAGQDALNQGRLEMAERDFRQVLALDPQLVGAYANLGVVYMRRKQWAKALDALPRA